MVPFVREMRYIVQKVHEELVMSLKERTPHIQAITFFNGTANEVIERLDQWSKDPTLKFEKFPCVILFEDVERGKSGEYDTVRCNMAIAMSTQQSYSSEQRQEKSFDPILYPIRDALMKAIGRRKSFVIYNPHQELPQGVDRKSWGRTTVGAEGGIKLSEPIDAIEINNLEIKLNPYSKTFNNP